RHAGPAYRTGRLVAGGSGRPRWQEKSIARRSRSWFVASFYTSKRLMSPFAIKIIGKKKPQTDNQGNTQSSEHDGIHLLTSNKLYKACEHAGQPRSFLGGDWGQSPMTRYIAYFVASFSRRGKKEVCCPSIIRMNPSLPKMRVLRMRRSVNRGGFP